MAFGWSENITSTQNKCPCLQPYAGIKAEHERLFSALAHAIPTAQHVLCFPGLDAALPSFSYSCVRPSPALDILLNNTVGPDLLYPALYLWSLNFKALNQPTFLVAWCPAGLSRWAAGDERWEGRWVRVFLPSSPSLLGLCCLPAAFNQKQQLLFAILSLLQYKIFRRLFLVLNNYVVPFSQ